MIVYHISDFSLTFFANGKPFCISSDHRNWEKLRNAVQDPNADPDKLAALADERTQLEAMSGGFCKLVGNNVYCSGQIMHDVWATKIVTMSQQGINHRPLMAALEDLQLNPYPKARERLPAFVELSKLGVLADGRIVALKAVTFDYKDCHSRTVSNKLGEIISWPETNRPDNADNDSECGSLGYHVGVYDYVNNFGSGGPVMLVAFWPRHVIGVSESEHAQKMRVYEYEVVGEVKREDMYSFINETKNQGLVTLPKPVEPTPTGPEVIEVESEDDETIWEKIYECLKWSDTARSTETQVSSDRRYAEKRERDRLGTRLSKAFDLAGFAIVNNDTPKTIFDELKRVGL